MMDEQIRRALGEHGRMSLDVASLGDDVDLYKAGMSSHATVNVMIALEEAFDVEFPDNMLRQSTFESIAAIRAALVELTRERQG
jgi:acyl carrier protein